jgi:hypothetical protein
MRGGRFCQVGGVRTIAIFLRGIALFARAAAVKVLHNMPKRWLTALLLALLATHAGAQTTQPDAEYLAAITQRADKHVSALKLDDAEKASHVRDFIVKHYQALRANHELRDQLKKLPEAEKLKAAQAESLKLLHDVFVSGLEAMLTPGQVETVKDEMTYNKVRNDSAAFNDMLPNLTEEQKAYIIAQLKEAREIAMDQGSSKEKHEVFGKYRGRINNYLAKQGYDLKQASKDWAERRKARAASDKQQPPQPQD